MIKNDYTIVCKCIYIKDANDGSHLGVTIDRLSSLLFDMKTLKVDKYSRGDQRNKFGIYFGEFCLEYVCNKCPLKICYATTCHRSLIDYLDSEYKYNHDTCIAMMEQFINELRAKL